MAVRKQLRPSRLGVDPSARGPQSSRRLTQTLKQAMDVLWAFTLDNPTWGVNELGRSLDLHKSTVSRLLATMEERRLVLKEPITEKYRLGLGILDLAGVVLGQMDLRQVSAPLLRQLAISTRETVSLAILDGAELVSIEHLPSPEPIKYLGGIGQRRPAHCSSGGKAILAYSTPAAVDFVVASGLRKYTRTTLTTRKALLRDLEETRARGYAVNRGEFTEVLNAAAAPIWDNSGTVVAAISVAGPAYRLNGETLRHSGERAKATAAEISRRLGVRDYPPRHVQGDQTAPGPKRTRGAA